MCLTIYKSKKHEHAVAAKDTVVYKVLDHDLKSPYQGKPYKLDKLYKGRLIVPKKWNTDTWAGDSKEIEVGFHYALTKKAAINWAVDNGFEGMPIFKCIIPKGATYIDYPSEGLGAANQIIIVKQLKG